MKRIGTGCVVHNTNKIGLFGGTFDPIHLGHLHGAIELKNRFNLDRIIFIPASIPPHKKSLKIAGTIHRLEMIRLAIKNHSDFVVSDSEIKRHGTSYSIDTISYFKSTLSKDTHLLFIIGYDAFLELHTWKFPEKVLNSISFIIMARPNESCYDSKMMKSTLNKYLSSKFSQDSHEHGNSNKNTIFFADIPLLNISSTKIRSLIKEDRSVKDLVCNILLMQL